MGTVYLLHFDRPFHHAKHYCGFSRLLSRRLIVHQSETRQPLLRAVRDAGISWVLAEVWTDVDRAFERRCKRRHNLCELCPICRGVVPADWDLSPFVLAGRLFDPRENPF